METCYWEFIDFYIKELNPETKQVLNVYDDTLDDEIKVNLSDYKIMGKNVNNTEIPILFQKHQNLHKAYISVKMV